VQVFLFPSCFLIKNFCAIFHLSVRATCSRYRILDFIPRIVCGEACRL
jgi:hypothetical protein